MPVEAILGDVQFSAIEPARERRFPFQHALPALRPDQLVRFARPEFRRALDRFAMHPAILPEALDPRAVREILRRLEDSLLNQVRLDILRHGEEASDPSDSLNPKLRSDWRDGHCPVPN